RLARQIEAALPESLREGEQRPFVDSAPVMEKPLAEKAGLGWMGKHTLILNSEAGSWFFLGELFTFLPLPVDESEQPDRCGECSACLQVCPTDAFPEPYVLDARRCISYLTIEHPGPIPEDLRPLLGNRIYGCDDCQLVCPWNRRAAHSREHDFHVRHGLDDPDAIALFAWDEATFLERTAGTVIRRLGHERWLRNLAVALGNAPTGPEVIRALRGRAAHPSPLVREHVHWAFGRHGTG
ncbi:MAG: tRNA epoxyqueuosine(34) reductase QueG, partial [Ectothiorhodospira sp.]